MFDLDSQENLVVVAGLGAGGALGLACLVILAFSGPGHTAARITPRRVLDGAAAVFSARPGALAGLWIGFALASAFIAILGRISGLTLGLANSLLAAAMIFLGHRTMLEYPARSAGIELPRNGYWSLFLRSIVFGLILLAVILAVFVLAALINALAGAMGASGQTTLFAIGAAGGVTTIALSTLFARMSFVYPACALGERSWFVAAIRRSRSAGTGLSVALWLMVILFVVLAVPVLLTTEALMSAAIPGSDALGFDRFDPDFASPGVWFAMIAGEVVTSLLIAAYSLASIACVSAAYRICVLERVESVGGEG